MWEGASRPPTPPFSLFPQIWAITTNTAQATQYLPSSQNAITLTIKVHRRLHQRKRSNEVSKPHLDRRATPIFTRFFRGKIGRQSGVSGAGLGLAIAKEIVDRHQGQIKVESAGKPGQGMTFSAWLPVQKV